MRDEMHQKITEVERNHWWYRARRNILIDFLKGHLPSGRKILDLGCGTGFLLEELNHWGEGWGIEASPIARAACKESSVPRVFAPDEFRRGERQTFDIVCLFDVLEHVENEEAFFQEWSNCFHSETKLVVSVPAFPLLWGNHDEASGHYRRYTRKTLHKTLGKCGYHEVKGTYFNTLLFPLVLGSRTSERFRRKKIPHGDLDLPGRWANETLYRIFSLESKWAERSRLPFGVSYLGIFERMGNETGRA